MNVLASKLLSKSSIEHPYVIVAEDAFPLQRHMHDAPLFSNHSSAKMYRITLIIIDTVKQDAFRLMILVF